MNAKLEEVSDPEACLERTNNLSEESRNLLDTLLLATDPGDRVPVRFGSIIEEHGGPLWQAALLIPMVTPSPGVTIDPRHYAAMCRTNPHLENYQSFSGDRPRIDPECAASLPPSDARLDAVVVAALLERTPRKLSKDGNLRSDVETRLLQSLGEDTHRWQLALQLARCGGLVRGVNEKLLGFPESPLRRLAHPEELLPEEDRSAALLLLRLVDDAWTDLSALEEMLCNRAREVLHSAGTEAPGHYAAHPACPFNKAGWSAVEAPSLRLAADVLTRAGFFESVQGPNGPTALRTPNGGLPAAPGFLVTPDLEIMVAPGEIPRSEYGRLCRMAPYVDGDRVHRHRLSRDGVAADIAAGHKSPQTFLSEYARIPLPPSVTSSLQEWGRSASRITLWTSVDVLEEDGVIRFAEDQEFDRAIDYHTETPSQFHMEGDTVIIPAGQDSLRLRGSVLRVGAYLGTEDGEHRYRLAPRELPDPEATLRGLAKHTSDGLVPGQLEASIWAANGESAFRAEEALVVHLSIKASESLRRDPIAGPLLHTTINESSSLVQRKDLPALEERLEALGFGHAEE
ncbi:MAG: hypothetical protein VX519_05405 [Myxococcota bacterium]|nr:hypothetical protein [Myxococcota bacterium]